MNDEQVVYDEQGGLQDAAWEGQASDGCGGQGASLVLCLKIVIFFRQNPISTSFFKLHLRTLQSGTPYRVLMIPAAISF